ncbi:peptide deformylase [[Mycoplasma] testudinis]|uniref:peptide deformylase n=1 Tax=[Mycoplasma] testudinis TaxID=33924 RepID=UPI000697245B|nr:peptide deformylase [[Mycoplasma] testudinis]
MDYQPSQEWLTFDEKDKMRQKCSLVTFPLKKKDLELINKMIAYVDESYNGNAPKYNIRPGIGIAANQLGVNKQMFYIHLDDGGVEYRYLLINPEMVAESPQRAYLGPGEGCLSVATDRDGYVIRSVKIRIKGYDYFQQKEIEIQAKGGLLAMCLQHEYDHLQGKLYYDRINPLNPYHVNPDWIKIGRSDREDKTENTNE